MHKKVSDLALLNIKRETKGFYIAIVKKLLEKSPLNYKLVRNAEWLNSLKMKEDRNVSVDQLTKCLEVLCNTGRIKADKCDEVISEFKSFMDEKKRLLQSLNTKHGWITFIIFIWLHPKPTRICGE